MKFNSQFLSSFGIIICMLGGWQGCILLLVMELLMSRMYALTFPQWQMQPKRTCYEWKNNVHQASVPILHSHSTNGIQQWQVVVLLQLQSIYMYKWEIYHYINIEVIKFSILLLWNFEDMVTADAMQRLLRTINRCNSYRNFIYCRCFDTLNQNPK